MNAYERAREERIASNRARLAALDLPGMASKFVDTHLSKPKRPLKPRGLAAKRQKRVSPIFPQGRASHHHARRLKDISHHISTGPPKTYSRMIAQEAYDALAYYKHAFMSTRHPVSRSA